ncbi:spermatogenesis-associated protein 1-like isoform X4 [Babylonia areolata]|uniref:spermatogenesis-associated protein 1-like isoform X4 n=1 Tax=Babylonia areolata TaxID=304850 RepID=UPI003FD2793E
MSRVSSFPSRPPSRPSSEQLCDLHVYQVPWSLWREPLNNLLNQSVADTVSLGIIRVHPDVPLVDLRQEIQRQLEEMAPKEYVFLRSVGRSLTRLKKKQEYQLKARDFLSPKYYAPELYILEATQEMQDAFAASERSSQQSRGSPGSRSYRNGYRSDRDRNGYPDRGDPRRGDDPRRTHRPASGYEHDAAYTNNTNEDSGVAGFSPEDQYKNRDKENYYDAANSKARDLQNRLNREQFNLDDDEDHKRRLRELEDGALMDSEHWARDQDERRRRAEEERHRTEEDKRREEERRKAEEEEEKRRRQKEEEEERRRREEEERRKSSDEDLNRFPSPPPLRMSPGDVERDSQSAQQRWREEKQKLLQEIEEARETRQMTEKEREELVKKAKALQTKTQNRRNQARDTWKKRYFEEKKKTPPLEEQTNRLKEELEGLHRKLMTVLEGPKEKNIKLGDSRPSQKNNYVIQCTRLQHDIDDLKRRIENAKMKLTAEMKLRNQAEMELRSLRAELVQKKINLSLVRSQQFAALSSGLSESTPVPDIPTGKRDEQSVTV